MKSALYRSLVMHNRLHPKAHAFHYNIFLFCLDLDAIDDDFKGLKLASRNRFNLFSFYDRDHLQVKHIDEKKTIREHLDAYLEEHHLKRPARVILLTNLRLLGYVFNPVSFYVCFDEEQKPYCAIAEVCNTFREMKLYLLPPETFDGKQFRLRVTKFFYVSPFIDHDAEFDFQIRVPDETMNIRIDDYKDGERFFLSTLTGKRQALTSARLLGYVFRFPFITLQVVWLIHWNALKLWLKKIPFHKKAEHADLQRDILKKV